MKLWTGALSANQRRVLQRLASFATDESFYLAGGTGLALRLGHRRSEDFDWFSQRPLGDPLLLADRIRAAGISFSIDRMERGTLHGRVSRVRVSFLEYPYPALGRLDLAREPRFRIASLRDIGCMKLSAIAGRGSRKDFVDLYALGRLRPLARLLQDYKLRYRVADAGHLVFALSYFDDAEQQPMPRMLKRWSWIEIKEAIRGWTQSLGRR